MKGPRMRLGSSLLIGVLLHLIPSFPASASGKIGYGSRQGMTVTVVSMSGINSTHAVIKTKHTREDAIGFCREYVGKVTPKCIQGELATHLNDEIVGDCASGRFTNFFGEVHQYLGKARDQSDLGSPKYIIKNIATGEAADGSSASGYYTNMEIFRALCPLKAPHDY